MGSDSREQKLRAVQAFLDGLVNKDIERMPLAADLVLMSPLDPEHPLIGKAPQRSSCALACSCGSPFTKPRLSAM